jgi:hypothetical protein
MDKKRLKAIGEELRQGVLERHSLEGLAERLLALFEEVSR